jgi:pilus assembly protein CpaC
MQSHHAAVTRWSALAALLLALCAPAIWQPIQAADSLSTGVQSSGVAPSNSRFLALGIGKSSVVELPEDAKDVLVADPKIANAVVRSARRAYLIGVAAGQTNVIFFYGDGRQIAAYDIEVGRDSGGLRDAIRKMLPGARVNVDIVGDSVVLSGQVANAADAQKVVEAAGRLVADPNKVVNGLTINGKEQVLLKVTVAEIQRTVLKQLGLDLAGSNIQIGNTVLNFNSDNPFSVQNQSISNNNLTPTFNLPSGGTIKATLRAMEQSGVMRTLAEPNLTAISGETAKFLAGGEFPVPGGQSCDQGGTCQVQIQFKQFGVGLEFTPVVLSEGRISLRIGTEVSELSSDGAIKMVNITIPALKVRRASSTVELPSGGSLALGGLIQEQTKQNINGVPGLMNLPILGTLFKSRDYQTGQTELVILVTPYIVNPVAPRELSRPDDGFADASDPQTVFMNQLNRTYGLRGTADARAYRGNFGFIND